MSSSAVSDLQTSEDEDSEHSSSEDAIAYEDTRYKGSKYVWLRATAEERALVKSLDREEANDLSQHLFNVHAVKALQYDRDRPNIASWSHKQSWVMQEPGLTKQWIPPTAWTAWPVANTAAPRAEERHGNLSRLRQSVDDNNKPLEAWQSVIDLKEELLALFLRRAKEGIAHHNDLMQSAQQAVHESLTHAPAIAATLSHNVATGRLVPIVDDTAAADILADDLDGVLTKFNKLLLALHKNRRGQFVSVHPHDVQKRLHSKKRRRSDAKEEVDSVKPPASHTIPPPLKALAPRDWSVVLGIASLAGWHPAIIERASVRCESLFGESMNWLTPPASIKIDGAESQQNNKRQTNVKSIGGLSYLCPFLDCPHARQSISGMHRFHEHMRRKHSWEFAAIDEHKANAAMFQRQDSTEDHPAKVKRT